MFRFLKYFAAAASMAALLALPFFVSTATSNNSLVSVIVELRDEPGAVYKRGRKSPAGAFRRISSKPIAIS
jgi:hypothetical protein